MFSQSSSIHQSPKCFVSYGTMGHIDPNQPPHKGKPWNALMAQDFVHRVDLVIPQESYPAIHRKFIEGQSPPNFYRVAMTLGDILSGDFFTEYIKKGNVLMLSEGKTTAGDLFTLKDGTLAMYLEKETYERVGLEGKPYGAKGARGLRPRWTVTYDLRNPSMFHGKKGFDRIVHACKNVLKEPKSWLFYNVNTSMPMPDPLQKHSPTKLTASPRIVENMRVQATDLGISADTLASGDRLSLEDETTGIYEWLSLIRLESPRVDSQDNIDPYLSRYSVPGEIDGEILVSKISWQGFFPAIWVRQLVINILGICPLDSWFSLSSTCMSKNVAGNSDELVLLWPSSVSGRYLAWEIKSSD